MATNVDKFIYLPIGCSCINQFQLNFRFGTSGYTSQLFDWAIATPDSTAKILREKGPFIDTLDNLEFLSPNIPYSTRMPGYFFWHLEKTLPRDALPIRDRAAMAPFFEDFASRHKHQSCKMFNIDAAEVRCIWSNIQPNLKIATESRGLDFAQFHLTNARYQKIKSAVKETRWENTSTWFVVRPSDVDDVLLDMPDVIVINTNRSSNYKGEIDLFCPVWDRIQQAKSTELLR